MRVFNKFSKKCAIYLHAHFKFYKKKKKEKYTKFLLNVINFKLSNQPKSKYEDDDF